MNLIILLLKRILRQGVIANVIGILTLFFTIFFGYKQIERWSSSNVIAIVQGKEDKENVHNFLIARTNDSIYALNPPVIQTFRNTSDYTINDVVVEVTVINPVLPKYYCYYNINPDFKLIEHKYVGNTTHTLFRYKAEKLMRNEDTPLFFKDMTFVPQEAQDSLFFGFDIKSEIMWDGNSGGTYFAHVAYTYVDDDNEVDHYMVPSNKKDSTIFFSWTDKVAKKLKNDLDDRPLDLFLFFHSKQDSIPFKTTGGWTTFYNISKANIDSICHFDLTFMQNHHHIVRTPPLTFDYNYSHLILGIILLVIAIFLIYGEIRNRIDTKHHAWTISAIILCLIGSVGCSDLFLLNKNIITVSMYNHSWILYAVAAVIIAYYLFLSLKYFIETAIVYRKKSKYSKKQYLNNRKEYFGTSGLILIYSILFLYISITYLLKIYNNPI